MTANRKILFYIIASGILSGLFFHLFSILSFGSLNGQLFSDTIRSLANGDHLRMGSLYSLLGGLISGVFILLYNHVFGSHNFGGDHDALNSAHFQNESEMILVRQIWPSMNVVRSGVNLVADGDKSLTESKKREVIKITQKNMKEIFELFDTIAKSHGN